MLLSTNSKQTKVGNPMTLKQRFIVEVFNGDRRLYLKERKKDYYKVQYAWEVWLDGLLKSGEISQQQWKSASF